MCDLVTFTANAVKPWLNIVCNSVNAASMTVANFVTTTLNAVNVNATSVTSSTVTAVNNITQVQRVTGDGTFGSNGTSVAVTGTVPVNAFVGYAPNATPTIGANSLFVGTTFAGQFLGELSCAVGAVMTMDIRWGASRAQRISIILPPGVALNPLRIFYDIQISSLGVAGSAFATFLMEIGRTTSTVLVYQERTTEVINTTVDMPVSIIANFSNADPGNVLRLYQGWMRREI